MNFLKKLFSSQPATPKNIYTFNVKCKRCGETITGRVDLANDLSADYEEGGDVYHVRKVLMGENRCFQRVEVFFKFDANKQVIEKDIIGGEFID